MPKLKTNKGAKKRFLVNGKGKIYRFQANKRHILLNKSSKRKRQLRGSISLSKVDAPRIKKLLISK